MADGKMVLLISHSPDRTRELFDKVVVLAKSEEDSAGRLAFYGSIENLQKFIEMDSIELIVREIEEDPDTYINRFGARMGLSLIKLDSDGIIQGN